MTTRSDRLVKRQVALNEATREEWDRFSSHRQRVTDLCLKANGGRAAILGAGNCNDIDLVQLAGHFENIHLVDLDSASLSTAIARQTDGVRARLVAHGDVDLGLVDALSAWGEREPSTPEIQAVLSSMRDETPLPIADLDLSVSSCLLTQLFTSVVDRLGPRHPRVVEIVCALRSRHLRTLARSLRPGALGVLVSDMVSSDTVPGLGDLAPHTLRGAMDALLRAGNFFTGTNPYVVASSLTTEPELKQLATDVVLHAPWIWDIAPERSYLVFAVSFRRSTAG
jgi:hypothetical protein